MRHPRVVIIGSGFGGLALGIRLQARGYAVTIVDKQPHPGGQAQPLDLAGFRFDMGPSLLTAPDLVEALFVLAGRSPESYFRLARLDPFYRIYFWDGSYLDYTGNHDAMEAALAQLNPKDALAYPRFMAHAKAFYESVIREGLGAQPFDWATFRTFLPKALKLRALSSAYALAAAYFRDPRIRFTFSFHPLFIGGNPFRAPAVYQMIPYLEKEGGVWYVYGGVQALARALARLFQDIGGTLYLSTEARRIVTQQRRVTGVETTQGFLPADIVVSNADYRHTYLQLVDKADLPSVAPLLVKRHTYSMSAFLIYLGLSKQYPGLLPHHTIVLGPRYRGLVRDIFRARSLPDDFSLYLHTPTRTEAAMAPPDGESLYLLSPVPNLRAPIDWGLTAEPYAQKILNHLQDRLLPDLQKHIVAKRLYTPVDFAKDRNCSEGSPWGVEPRLSQTANLRPHNKSLWLEGLYLVGTSTHPGAGVPGVILSAQATERAILQNHSVSSQVAAL